MIYDCIQVDQIDRVSYAPTSPRTVNVPQQIIPFNPTTGDIDNFQRWLIDRGVDHNYGQIIVLDIEGERRLNLWSDSHPVYNDAIDDYVGWIKITRRCFPDAQVGVYGVPKVPLKNEWSMAGELTEWMDEHRHLGRLFKELDIICPVFYWRWLDGPENGTGTHRPMIDYFAMAKSVCRTCAFAFPQKPCLPYLMGTFHNGSHDSIAGQPIPHEQLIQMGRSIKRFASGLNYWGLIKPDDPDHNEAVKEGLRVLREAV